MQSEKLLELAKKKNEEALKMSKRLFEGNLKLTEVNALDEEIAKLIPEATISFIVSELTEEQIRERLQPFDRLRSIRKLLDSFRISRRLIQ